MGRTLAFARQVALVAIPLLLVTSSGCTFLSQVVMTLQDRRIPPLFDGLAGKKVAIVCLDAHNLRVPNGDAEALATRLHGEVEAGGEVVLEAMPEMHSRFAIFGGFAQ